MTSASPCCMKRSSIATRRSITKSSGSHRRRLYSFCFSGCHSERSEEPAVSRSSLSPPPHHWRKKTMHLKRHIGALGLSLLLGSALFAQAAPKPPQLAAARSVFISNDTGAYGTQSDVAYNQFYAAIQNLDRFTIVVDPS